MVTGEKVPLTQYKSVPVHPLNATHYCKMQGEVSELRNEMLEMKSQKFACETRYTSDISPTKTLEVSRRRVEIKESKPQPNLFNAAKSGEIKENSASSGEIKVNCSGVKLGKREGLNEDVVKRQNELNEIHLSNFLAICSSV